MRIPGNGDLLCAVGWSPTGIDYGSADNQPVHLICMYYIPDSAKIAYLKEISFLATSIKKEQGIHAIAHAEDIAVVRERLLDWVSASIESGVPETKARMIRLETRQAALSADRQRRSGPTNMAGVDLKSKTTTGKSFSAKTGRSFLPWSRRRV